MKKIILLLIISIPFVIGAQDLKMGILVNPQVSWIRPAGNNDIVNEGTKMGIDIGLSIERYFADNYAFLTGLSLNNIGGIFNFSENQTLKVNSEDQNLNAGNDLTVSLQYIKIPLALKFKTKEIGYLTYFTQIGMEGGINVKAIATDELSTIEEESISDEVNLFNAGYLIGGGAEYSLGGNTSIVFGIQYQNGIVDLLKTTDNKVITQRVTLLLGIMF